MPKKEYGIITRLRGMKGIFERVFTRREVAEQILPTMAEEIANIIRACQTLQAGLSHLQEAHFDDKALTDEIAHVATFAMNLPVVIRGDAGYWGYALDLVDPPAFEEAAESVNLEQLELLAEALLRVRAIKRDYRDKSRMEGGILH